MSSTISSNFSFSRLGMLLRKEWGENRRQLLLLSVLCLGMMAIASAFLTFVTYDDLSNHIDLEGKLIHDQSYDYAYSSYHNNLKSVFAFIFLAFTSLTASLAFSSTATKEGALRDITTPALQCEKFTMRFIVYIIGGWIAGIAGWAIVSFGSYFVMDIFTRNGEFFFPTSMGPLFDGNTLRDLTSLAALLLTVLFLQSLFFLGSTVWPRSSFFKTFAAAFAIAMCMFFIGISTTSVFVKIIDPGSKAYIPRIFFLLAPYMSLTLFMTAVNYAVAFLRYRENDVIRRW